MAGTIEDQLLSNGIDGAGGSRIGIVSEPPSRPAVRRDQGLAKGHLAGELQRKQLFAGAEQEMELAVLIHPDGAIGGTLSLGVSSIDKQKKRQQQYELHGGELIRS